MQFNNLVKGNLIKRYKRFLADVELEDGSIITAHCTNTGSMTSCIEEGAPVLLSPSDNPKRKTPFTWEMIWINNNWVGINTNNANTIAFELISNQLIPGLTGLSELKREVKFGDSRFDIFGKDGEQEVWMEVKNVSMKQENWALFPDAPTTRGQKHLKTLMQLIETGKRAAMIYLIQRSDVDSFGTAEKIDPEYDRLLKKAKVMGVEVYPVQVMLSENEISFYRVLEYV